MERPAISLVIVSNPEAAAVLAADMVVDQVEAMAVAAVATAAVAEVKNATNVDVLAISHAIVIRAVVALAEEDMIKATAAAATVVVVVVAASSRLATPVEDTGTCQSTAPRGRNAITVSNLFGFWLLLT